MAKAVKAVGTAIMIVGAVVATGGMALAMGAGVGLLGSASLATSAVLSVGSFSVSAGTLLSVGTLVSSIGGSLAQPKVSSAGGALGWVGDPNGPLHFAAGRIAVGGDLRHKAAYGPNDRMYFSAVTVVSDAGPIDAFESFTANDIAVTFDASGKANTSYYANVMWRRTQLGFQPEGSYLASPSGLQGGASLPNWGASHKLSGKAAFILTLSENSKQSAYKGQYPKPRTIIRGLRVYDWRRDSTYPGGAGPQRLNDPSTWAYSANPILWSVKWLLGLWEGPTGKGAPQVDYQVGGIGTRWENIDIAAFTEAANIADTHGWTCAAWPSTDDDKAQVLDAFLQAGGAYYIERAGKASCIHRAAPRVSVATITAADTAGPIELDTSASYLDRKNTGVATYLSEADGWKMTALPEVSSSQWVTEDGGRKRSVPVTYSYVDKAKQAAELICLGLAHTREGISGRIPLKSYMQGIGPGSAFTITEPEFVLDGLKCLCLETSYDANTGVHTVTFVSETDAKYPYAFGQTPSPPPPPALTPVDPTHVSPPLPGDWTITPRPPAPGGGQLPGFDLGGGVSNETATAVIVEHGPTATGPWTQAYQGPPTVTTIPIDGLQPGATYYIAVQYQRNQNYSDRHVYGPYTAPNLEPSHLNGEPVQDILDKLTNTADLTAANAAAVADMGDRVDGVIAEAEGILAGAEGAAALAVLKAGEAGEAAEASNTAAGIATTKADEAGASAQAANVEKLAAEAARDGTVGVALSQMPATVDRQFWSSADGNGGAPETLPDASTSTWQIVNDPDLGQCWSATGAGGAAGVNLTAKGVLPRLPGRKYEVTFRGKIVTLAPDGTTNIQVLASRMDGAYASVAGRYNLNDISRSETGLFDYTRIIDADSSVYSAAAFIRVSVSVNRSDGAPIETRIGAVKIEDVTAREAAKAAASASVLASAQAEAFAGDAGDWAAASEGSATTAATRAGEALTYRNQAASSASDAAGSATTASTASGTAVTARDAAIGARNDAQAAAATAVTQSSSASTSAAEAQLAANLAAQIGGGSMNPNPQFAAWVGTEASGPDNWFAVNAGNGALSKGPGANGLPHSLRTAASGTANYSVNCSTFAGAVGGEWLALTVEFTLVSGDLRGSGVQIHKRQDGSQIGSSLNLNFATEADAAGNVAGSGVAGRRYTFTKLLDGRQAGVNGYSIFLRTRLSTFSPVGAATIDWHRASVQVATAEQVETNTVLPAVQAQASLALSTSVDALTQLGLAAFELILASGGNPAYIKALAEPGGSEIAFAATKLFLRNVVGDQIVTALELINGEAYFGAPVSVDIAGRRLTIGPGFGVSSGLVLWFGPNTVSLASMSRTNGYFAMGTDGKVYLGDSELNGSAGFHAQADFAVRVGTRTTAGLVTTSLVTITASGNTDTVSYDWSQIGGEETWTITAPSGPATAFRINVSSPGEIKRAQFACLVRDSGSGKSFTIIVGATAIYNV